MNIKSKIRKKIQSLYILYSRYKIPQLHGKFSLLFNKIIYQGFSYGKNVVVWGDLDIVMYGNERITIGDNVRIISNVGRSGITVYSKCKLTTNHGTIQIGNNVALSGTAITSNKSIVIEDGTMIAPNVIIVDSDFHVTWPPEKRWTANKDDLEAAYSKVHIGKNVWIGMNSIVLKGVSIGDNSIIAAGSVVVHDIPSNVVAAGNPAKVVKSLIPK